MVSVVTSRLPPLFSGELHSAPVPSPQLRVVGSPSRLRDMTDAHVPKNKPPKHVSVGRGKSKGHKPARLGELISALRN